MERQYSTLRVLERTIQNTCCTQRIQMCTNVWTTFKEVTMNYTLIVVLDTTKQYALLMQKNRGPYPGMLNYPGGKIETSDKTYMAAAIRELKEETGIERDTLNPLVTCIFPSGNILHVFYCITRNIEEPKQIEDEILMWHNVSDILDVNNPALAGEGNLAYFTKATLIALEEKN